MYYKNAIDECVQVEDIYQIDIVPDIVTIGKSAIPNLQTGWFSKQTTYPAAVFYLLGSLVRNYISNTAQTVNFTYYFEVRAFTEPERDNLARNLCSVLSTIYESRRTQYDDSFESATGTYIKRITFTFTVKLGV
ncbi:hypothetical protein [Anaeromassilibacillus senegalensis]|uniref:hypothetical protein n=1 Tax=Anaeromassilibacillus senegalensis TaxID=1673717 RepID=UPI000680E0C7|nr:hypothetical protein [Anaeromassilibacillus senegalensis]